MQYSAEEIKRWKQDPIPFLEQFYRIPDTGEKIDFDDWEWQAKILRDLIQTKKNGKRQYTAGVISTPRQQGKSVILQCVGLYFLFMVGMNMSIYSIACDKDQASLVPDRVKASIAMNPELEECVKITRNVITCPYNGNKWTILSSDHASAPGISADVLLWDELGLLPEYDWNLVYLLLPSMSARSEPLMLIASTVGEFEDGPLNDYMKLGRDDSHPDTYLYETHEIQSPLTNMALVERDRELMPPAVFARHYQNIVMRGAGFLSDEDIEAIIHPTAARPSEESFGQYIGADYGLTKDKATVICLSKHYDGLDDVFIWSRSRVFAGTKEEPVNLNEVKDIVKDFYRHFNTRKVLIDKWQAVAAIQELQGEWGTNKVDGYTFTQQSRRNLFKNIFTIIRSHTLIIYSDILKDCWRRSCAICPDNMTCKEQDQHNFLRELQGLQCDSDYNVTHGERGDDIVVGTALALMAAAQDRGLAVLRQRTGVYG